MRAETVSENSVFLCRTCYVQTDELISLTTLMAVVEEGSRQLSYGELLKEVTQINITEDNLNRMPQHICDSCLFKLKSSHAFIRQAQEVNVKLLSLLQVQETSSGQKTDCLQESEIDIQTCLEIKMESEENATDQCAVPTANNELEFKLEISEEASLDKLTDLTANIDDIEGATFDHAVFDDDSLHKDTDATPESEVKKEKVTPKHSKRGRKLKKARHREESEKPQKIPPSKDSTEDADIAVPCLKCNKIFNNSKELSRHLRNTHLPDDQKCACPICGVKFTRSCNMYKHMRKLHDPEAVKELLPAKEKPFECDICHRRYTQKRQLSCHIKEKHSNTEEQDKAKEKDREKPDKKKTEIRPLCFVCGSSFSNKAHLIVHMTRHTGERPFKCDLCDRAFPRISDLTIHRRIHTGEKPFKCKLCEKAFRVSTKLANHMRSHTNERPYKCKQCERSFKYSKDLNIHMRIHTGERPYCCAVCGSTFTQSNSLKAHRMKLGHMDDGVPTLMPMVS